MTGKGDKIQNLDFSNIVLTLTWLIRKVNGKFKMTFKFCEKLWMQSNIYADSKERNW